jgi:hypothetical protein
MTDSSIDRAESPVGKTLREYPEHHFSSTVVASRLTRNSYARPPRTFYELQSPTRWWLRFFDATSPERTSKLLCSEVIAPCVFPNLTVPIYIDIQTWVQEHGYPARRE